MPNETVGLPKFENPPKPPKQRTPKSPEAITAGALALPLAQRVELCKKLKESIQAEVKLAESQAKEAASLVNGL